MKRNNSLSKQIDDLAAAIIARASGPDTSLPDKLEAFKIVSVYHLGVLKLSKGEIDDDQAGSRSFDAFAKGLRTIGGKDA